jgi:predicted transglutaminase-like cysteine proteinase
MRIKYGINVSRIFQSTFRRFCHSRQDKGAHVQKGLYWLGLVISGITAFAVSAAMFAAPLNAGALASPDASFAPAGMIKPPPYGWRHFCAAQPAECEPAPALPSLVQLTVQSWTELNKINAIANEEIEPISDEDHYRIYEQNILNWWTYPDDGKGNCNDYALMKRKLLIEAGWPMASLWLTVVIDHHGAGHLILMIRTDRGDLILDNMRKRIVRWNRTGYRFVMRQSELDPNKWVSIEAKGELRTAADETHADEALRTLVAATRNKMAFSNLREPYRSGLSKAWLKIKNLTAPGTLGFQVDES